MLQDFERVRAIFEIAVTQALDMPEIVWKAYIDFEAEEGDREKTRSLYERLLERTGHYKVYNSYAHMEASVLGGGEDEDGNEIEGEAGDLEKARDVYRRGYSDLRARGEKEDVSAVFCNEKNKLELISQRAALLAEWKKFEIEHGTAEDVAKVQEMMPQMRKKWRKAVDDGVGLEECELLLRRRPSWAPQ